jgi:DNA repair exonuclease SbcCD nuclease subunit
MQRKILILLVATTRKTILIITLPFLTEFCRWRREHSRLTCPASTQPQQRTIQSCEAVTAREVLAIKTRLRFVHFSDSHLGYRQYGLKQRLKDWSRATQEIVDYAVKNEVDFVLHSGDLFNSNLVDHTTLIDAIKILNPLKQAGIPFFVIDGNHDRRKGSQSDTANNVLQYLELVDYLSPEGDNLKNAIRQIGNTNIIGLGYHGIYLRSKIENFFKQMPEAPNIILLHAAVEHHVAEGQPDITLSELEMFKSKAAYLALGHAHNAFQINDWIFNPGSPEYYRFTDQDYNRIFYDVVLEDGVAEVSEVEVRSARRMFNLNVELASNDQAIKKTVELLDREYADDQIAGSLIRVVLGGRTPPDLSLAESKAAIEARYSPLYCLIIDNTASPEGAFAEAETSIDELEFNMFQRTFSSYDKQAPEVAAFARGIMREILDMGPASSEDAEVIAQHVSNFRKDNL